MWVQTEALDACLLVYHHSNENQFFIKNTNTCFEGKRQQMPTFLEYFSQIRTSMSKPLPVPRFTCTLTLPPYCMWPCALISTLPCPLFMSRSALLLPLVRPSCTLTCFHIFFHPLDLIFRSPHSSLESCLIKVIRFWVGYITAPLSLSHSVSGSFYGGSAQPRLS